MKKATVRIPADVLTRVDRRVAVIARSRAWVVEEALSDWLDREENRDRLTCEGLQNVSTGQVVGHGTVDEWARSLGSTAPLPRPSSTARRVKA